MQRRIGANERARSLRQQATRVERILWQKLRDRQLGGHKFVRQIPIDRFVVDFVCRERHLIVELDGGQHARQEEADHARTEILEKLGFRVLRLWNNDVLENLDGSLAEILRQLDAG